MRKKVVKSRRGYVPTMGGSSKKVSAKRSKSRGRRSGPSPFSASAVASPASISRRCDNDGDDNGMLAGAIIGGVADGLGGAVVGGLIGSLFD